MIFLLSFTVIVNITDTSIEHREDTTSTDREEPDGEENFGVTTNQLPTASSSAVKVPNWIGNSSKLNVIFKDRAAEQLSELELNKVCLSECR